MTTKQQNTKARAQTITIKQEMKWLYQREQQISKQLYQTHLYNANVWKQTWDNIEHGMNSKLQIEITKILQQKQKVRRLQDTQSQQQTTVLPKNT
jgi:hypothetical protein